MDQAEVWRKFFREWPADISPRGVVVTSFDEQIVFVSFLTTDDLLMIERQTPDTVGGRRVLIPYSNIQAVKIVDPVEAKVFTAAGFRQTAVKSAKT